MRTLLSQTAAKPTRAVCTLTVRALVGGHSWTGRKYPIMATEVPDDLFTRAEAPRSDTGEGSGGGPRERTAGLERKGTAAMHLLPKVVALVLYFLDISAAGTGWFVALIVLLALDFWMTKNVTGRRLVGLRWWNDTEQGWKFESRPEGGDPGSRADRRVFWFGLGIPLVLWILMLLLALVSVLGIITASPTRAIEAGVACALLGSNFYGYVKCSKDAQKRVAAQAQSVMASHLMGRLWPGSSLNTNNDGL